MYVYDLSVAMSDKDIILDECPELINAIKEAIAISNKSFSATRYKRKIELIDFIDSRHMHLKMFSQNEINPTRSLSSLSRALVQNERSKNSQLLEGHLVNGCVFNATVIPKTERTIHSPEDLSNSEVLQILVEMVAGTKYEDVADETLYAIKELLIQKLNPQ